ncbi:hypothetical protein M011DRAFT_497865 [Sporormia fimetaria CBS 119925]|uniref:N-acetyltransferase domain-containing protein n=1 Tax=Sporormia fimetaria CBS 119925 TaxID=1340428 RepID=A0A6A6UVQ0_9PLEO|nr:hypothetical protein M011DRAFT_497865 [Sporormia fimetaria CBS 119925]
METRQWQQTVKGATFLVSTSKDLLPHSFVQSVFENPAVYWAKKPSQATTKKLIDNSCTLGLYTINEPTAVPALETTTPIGIARMVTDYTTFAYLTDVFIIDEFRRFGLGKWLIRCCREVILEEMEDFRWLLLFTGNEQHAHMYQREFGMQQLGRSPTGLFSLGAKREQIEAAVLSCSKKDSNIE